MNAGAGLPVYQGDDMDMLARHMRGALVSLSHEKRVPHLASELSCIDIIAAAYWNVLKVDPSDPKAASRDRFILSKGHAAKALYVALGYRGFFPIDLLASFTDEGGPLPEHPGPDCAPGVELATGSLGHGLPVGVGLALSARLAGRGNRVFVLLSDGECNEGSVWEAAMLAAAQSLDNLVAIVDFNGWQATGRSREVMALDPLADKWRAFGWSADEVAGHDIAAVTDLLRAVPFSAGRPTAIIANTVKGKGVSFMEDDNNWHYRIPSADEVRAAYDELGL